MSRLRIFLEGRPASPQVETSDGEQISSQLSKVGVRFERWQTDPAIGPGASSDAVLAAYAEPIAALKAQGGYQAVDVVSLTPDHPQRAEFRQKFLSEHTHAEDEVRFFVAGQGLFSLHIESQVFEILCRRGDLISVPAGTKHWFDMGPAPNFVAVRLFTNPQGWVAQFTGATIAESFPRLDA